MRRLDTAERGAVCAAFERYLGTIPESKKFRADHTLVPFQTEDAIAVVIGDREAEFVDWLATFAREYAAVVRDDHRLFVDAFRNDEITGVHSTRQG